MFHHRVKIILTLTHPPSKKKLFFSSTEVILVLFNLESNNLINYPHGHRHVLFNFGNHNLINYPE